MADPIYDLDDEGFKEHLHWKVIQHQAMLICLLRIYVVGMKTEDPRKKAAPELEHLVAIAQRSHETMVEEWYDHIRRELDKAQAKADLPDSTDDDERAFEDLEMAYIDARKAAMALGINIDD